MLQTRRRTYRTEESLSAYIEILEKVMRTFGLNAIRNTGYFQIDMVLFEGSGIEDDLDADKNGAETRDK